MGTTKDGLVITCDSSLAKQALEEMLDIEVMAALLRGDDVMAAALLRGESPTGEIKVTQPAKQPSLEQEAEAVRNLEAELAESDSVSATNAFRVLNALKRKTTGNGSSLHRNAALRAGRPRH